MSSFRDKMFGALFLTGAVAFVGAILATLVADRPLPSPAMVAFLAYMVLAFLWMVGIALAELLKSK